MNENKAYVIELEDGGYAYFGAFSKGNYKPIYNTYLNEATLFTNPLEVESVFFDIVKYNRNGLSRYENDLGSDFEYVSDFKVKKIRTVELKLIQ